LVGVGATRAQSAALG